MWQLHTMCHPRRLVGRPTSRHLGPWGFQPSFLSIYFYLIECYTPLIAPQCSYVYLFSFPTWRPIVYTPVPSSPPWFLPLHADSHPSYRYPPVFAPKDYLCLRPCAFLLYKYSPTSMYFLSSIIISLIPLNIALRNPKLLSYSLDESLTLDALQTHQFFTRRLTRPLETVCILLLDLVVALAKFLLVFIFYLGDTLVRAHLLSWQPLWELLPDDHPRHLSLSIPTLLHFSRVRKPVLDTSIASRPWVAWHKLTCPKLISTLVTCFVKTVTYGR